MKTKIYALRDKSRFLRYVGKTKQSLQERLQGHLDGARKGEKTHKGDWIRSMLCRGFIPTITLIGIYEGDGNKEEIAWIKYFREGGVDLVNGTDGGDGISNPSEGVREKISKTLKERYADPQERKRLSESHKNSLAAMDHVRQLSILNVGRKFTQEQRERVATAHRGIRRPPLSKEWKAKLSASLSGRKLTPEHCLKLSQNHRGGTAGKGFHHSVETREKMKKSREIYLQSKRKF